MLTYATYATSESLSQSDASHDERTPSAYVAYVSIRHVCYLRVAEPVRRLARRAHATRRAGCGHTPEAHALQYAAAAAAFRSSGRVAPLHT
jgi:hypothetical protein